MDIIQPEVMTQPLSRLANNTSVRRLLQVKKSQTKATTWALLFWVVMKFIRSLHGRTERDSASIQWTDLYDVVRERCRFVYTWWKPNMTTIGLQNGKNINTTSPVSNNSQRNVRVSVTGEAVEAGAFTVCTCWPLWLRKCSAPLITFPPSLWRMKTTETFLQTNHSGHGAEGSSDCTDLWHIGTFFFFFFVWNNHHVYKSIVRFLAAVSNLSFAPSNKRSAPSSTAGLPPFVLAMKWTERTRRFGSALSAWLVLCDHLLSFRAEERRSTLDPFIHPRGLC